MNNNSQPDWAAIKADYLQAKLSLIQICAKHGISNAKLTTQRRKGHWPSRRKKTAQTRAALIKRLFRLWEEKVEMVEKADTNMSADKEVALLGNLARALEKLIELDDKQKSTLKAPRQQPSGEMIELNAKLTQRIKNLDQ